MALSTSGQQSINQVTIKHIASRAQHLAHAASTHGHRAFLLVECHHHDDSSAARQWFDGQPDNQRLWLPQLNNTDRTDQIQQLLGTESILVVYDARHGLDPRLLAASAGTLGAGGVYLLLSPPLSEWADTYDQDYGTEHSVFLQRLAQHFKRQCVPSSHSRLWHTAPPVQTLEDAKLPIPAGLAEQDEILESLLVDTEAKLSQVIVIQADRGRGKSTLLARLLLSDRTPPNTAITALHRSATAVVHQHCLANGLTVKTVPLQQALLQSHELLLVDEAATIPLDQLMDLASVSKQIVFATTVDGYEGAGRGFATRFAKQLDEHDKTWRLHQPTKPCRWQAGDPLEALFNSALLLKSDLPKIPTTISLDDVRCKQLSPEQLIQDPQLLEHTFAILARAHYQTTAMDLRHMLDSPGMAVWMASINNSPCAAALVCTEGEIDDELYSDVAHKKRRLKHQLLPQLLTQFTLSKRLLSQRYQRIVRIAVVPAIQGRGIGSVLAQAVIKHSANGYSKVDAIGTSFGADEATLGFWLKQGLTPVHLGYKRNPRSGLPAACMLLAHSKATITAQQQAQRLLQRNLQILKQANTSRHDEPSQYSRLIDLILSQALKKEDEQLSAMLSTQNPLFAAGARNFLDSLEAIHSLMELHQLPKQHKARHLFDELARNAMAGSSRAMRTQNHELASLINELLQ